MILELSKSHFESSCGRVSLYQADCRIRLPLYADEPSVAIITDPPYGIRYQHSGGGKGKHSKRNAQQPITGDDAKPDLAHLFEFQNVLLFGADHLRDHLPAGGSFIAWDKAPAGKGPKDSFVDCEFAWTTARVKRNCFPYLWKGIVCEKQGEENGKRYHPTQKPIGLMRYCIGIFDDVDLIIDPYMGSGSTGLAAIREGKRFVGIELEARHFQTAVERIERELAEVEFIRMNRANAKLV